MEEAFVRLSEVLITPRIVERISRNYTTESDRAFELIDRKIKKGDITALQDICDYGLKFCHAESVGLSLCGFINEMPVFNMHVSSGPISARGKIYSPRDGTPCGTVLDLFSYQLFHHPERHYPWVRENNFVIPELITMPIYLDNHEPFGTFWLIHKEGGLFDREDIRIISILVAFIRKALNNNAFQEVLKFS